MRVDAPDIPRRGAPEDRDQRRTFPHPTRTFRPHGSRRGRGDTRPASRAINFWRHVGRPLYPSPVPGNRARFGRNHHAQGEREHTDQRDRGANAGLPGGDRAIFRNAWMNAEAIARLWRRCRPTWHALPWHAPTECLLLPNKHCLRNSSPGRPRITDIQPGCRVPD